MRKQVFEKLNTLPVGYFDTHPTGDIISHISYDIDTINASLSHDLVQVMTSLYTVIGSLVFMWNISKPMILVFVITVPASILFTRYRSKKVRPLFRERSRKLGELNGYAEEMLSGCRTIGAYLMDKLTETTKPYAFVQGVRGKGLMLGIVLDHSGAKLKSVLQDNGLIALTAGETVVRFLPALNLSKEIADEALAIIEKSLAEYAASL